MNLILCPPYLHGVPKMPLTDTRIKRLALKSLHPLSVPSVP